MGLVPNSIHLGRSKSDHGTEYNVLCKCLLLLFLCVSADLSLAPYGGHSLPSREDLEGPEKPSETLRDPAQGRAGRPGPPVLQAVPAGLAEGP